MEQDPHIEAGLTPAGINEEGEGEWIGTPEQWDAYEKLTEKHDRE